MTDVGLSPLRTRVLIVADVAVDPGISIGGPSGAHRNSGPIPGGGDWLTARVVPQTDDGATVAMEFTGIRHGPADVMDQIARREAVDPASYYFRIVPRFTTSDPRYEWLNGTVAVGTGHRRPEGPVYHVYEVL